MELSGAPIAVLENVDGPDGVSVKPGAKWELPADSKAYLLDLLGGNGVALHASYLDQLRTTMHDIAETPRTAFGDSGRDHSGAALEVEIQPLAQRVRRKRCGWNGFYAQRNMRILSLLDRFSQDAAIGGHRHTATIWPSILPSDVDANVRNNVSLVASGIRSRRTAIVGLGSPDPDGELALIDADQAGSQARGARDRRGLETRPVGCRQARTRGSRKGAARMTAPSLYTLANDQDAARFGLSPGERDFLLTRCIPGRRGHRVRALFGTSRRATPGLDGSLRQRSLRRRPQGHRLLHATRSRRTARSCS